MESPIQAKDSSEPRIVQLYGSGRYNNQGNYHVPPEGLILPDTIIIPSDLGRRSREDINAFGKEVGVVPPTSLTRPNAIQRIRDRLMNLGYRVSDKQEEGEVLKGESVNILPPFENKVAELEPEPEVRLPAFISNSIFNSNAALRSFVELNHLESFISIKRGRLRADLTRDVHEFLANLKYTQTPNGYARSEGYVMRAGLTLDQLLTPQLAAQVLQETTTIPIHSDDLLKLNRTLAKFVGSQTRWASFEEYSRELARTHDMSPELVKVATVLNYLALLTPVALKGVLRLVNKGRSKAKGLDQVYELVRPRYELTMRELEERIPSRGVAPSTITLATAIQDGYTFTYDQYKEDILNFLGYNRLPQTHLDYLVELFQHYPDFFVRAREFRPGRTLAQEIIRSYYNETPSHVQTLYTFVFNYPLEISEPEEIATRREEFRSLPTRYVETIKQIYRTADIDDILSRPVHPLELYVIAINKTKLSDLTELVAGFGMIVPEHIVNRIVRSYILLNIPVYDRVITRSESVPSIDEVITKQPASREQLLDLLAEYTDFEIVERFGYTGGFENRRQLISNIYETIAEDGFILLKEYDPTLTVNYETTLMTPLEDLPAPYLVYGTPFEYRVVEIDELIHSFRYENNSVVFQHISGNDHKLYNIAEITRLQSILPSIKAVNPELSASVDQLMEIIRRGVLANLRRTAETQRFIQRLAEYTGEEREQIRELLYSVFYAGMYMRKWLGPGNRYPVKSQQTRGMGSPEPRVVLALGNIGDNLERLSPELRYAVHRLLVVDYRDDGNINFSTNLLLTEIGPIAMGKSCIRVGSKDLILSAYYYISVIFEEIIPDFDPNSVESIA